MFKISLLILITFINIIKGGLFDQDNSKITKPWFCRITDFPEQGYDNLMRCDKEFDPKTHWELWKECAEKLKLISSDDGKEFKEVICNTAKFKKILYQPTCHRKDPPERDLIGAQILKNQECLMSGEEKPKKRSKKKKIKKKKISKKEDED